MMLWLVVMLMESLSVRLALLPVVVLMPLLVAL